MRKLVFDVGVHEKGIYRGYIGNKKTIEYRFWSDMLRRCYSEDFQRVIPAYKGCTVSENFKDFQYFAEWCNNQVGFGIKGYALDKDILEKDNQVYSENTCVFVPREINNLFIDRKMKRGKYPVGVSYHKASCKYKAAVSKFCKMVWIGVYETPDEAFLAYRVEKELHIKVVAESYKNGVDERVYNRLMEWKILEDV